MILPIQVNLRKKRNNHHCRSWKRQAGRQSSRRPQPSWHANGSITIESSLSCHPSHGHQLLQMEFSEVAQVAAGERQKEQGTFECQTFKDCDPQSQPARQIQAWTLAREVFSRLGELLSASAHAVCYSPCRCAMAMFRCAMAKQCSSRLGELLSASAHAVCYSPCRCANAAAFSCSPSSMSPSCTA